MAGKKGQCNSDLLESTAKDQAEDITCEQILVPSPPHRTHTRISPTPFGANSRSASVLRYNSRERGGTQNDWEDQKRLRLRVY